MLFKKLLLVRIFSISNDQQRTQLTSLRHTITTVHTDTMSMIPQKLAHCREQDTLYYKVLTGGHYGWHDQMLQKRLPVGFRSFIQWWLMFINNHHLYKWCPDFSVCTWQDKNKPELSINLAKHVDITLDKTERIVRGLYSDMFRATRNVGKVRSHTAMN